MLVRKNMKAIELAEKMGISRQLLSYKFKHNNFTESEMYKIAAALDCELTIELRAAAEEKEKGQ